MCIAFAQRRVGRHRSGDIAVEIARLGGKAHGAIQKVGGVAVHPQTPDAQPRDPLMHRRRAACPRDEQVGRVIVAAGQHQVQQRGNRNRTRRAGQLLFQRQRARVDHRKDPPRHRDLVGAGHREERIAIERERFPGAKVAHDDADRAVGQAGKALELGDQARFGGLLHRCLGRAKGVGVGQWREEQAKGGEHGDGTKRNHASHVAKAQAKRKRVYRDSRVDRPLPGGPSPAP